MFMMNIYPRFIDGDRVEREGRDLCTIAVAENKTNCTCPGLPFFIH